MEGEEVYEVEEILRYRRNEENEEHFLVKWVGFPDSEATWEPLAHLNESCRELIAKARALFVWRRGTSPSATPSAIPSVSSGAAPHGAAAQNDSQAASLSEDDASASIPAFAGSPTSGDDCDPVPPAEPPPKRARSKPPPPQVLPPGSKQGLESAISRRDSHEDLVVPSVPKPVRSELRCICGAVEHVSPADQANCVACKVCAYWLHASCIENALGKSSPTDFVCPTCRLECLDEFYPIAGDGLLRHTYASSSSTFTLHFSAPTQQWMKQQWALHLRCVGVSGSDLSGPAWPHSVQGKMNGRLAVQVDPPKYGHVRREQSYNLTPMLRSGTNTLELRFVQNPDKPRGEADMRYCVGVVLTRPRSPASIVARIKTRSNESVAFGRERVKRLLSQVVAREQRENECKVTGNFGRTLKPLCPVSFMPIEDAALGRKCQHVQVFDLQAYIAVNKGMRSLDKRWTCPVCSIPLRPDDIILDKFVQGILTQLRGDEENVDAVVFNEDCTWSAVSTAKDGGQGSGEDDDGLTKEAAVALSDSE